MEKNEKKQAKVAGGKIDRMGTAERLEWARGEVEHLDGECGTLLEQAARAEDVRRCVWHGQADCGKRLTERLGKPAFPFEGSSDLRVRLADQVVNEKMMLLVVGALRAEINVRGMESNDDALGGRLSTLLKWALRNDMGLEWIYTLARLAHYREAGSPAAALAGVYWDRELGVRLRDVRLSDVEQVLLLALHEGGAEPGIIVEQVESLRRLMATGADLSPAEELLGIAYPEVSEKRRAAAVRELSAGLRRGDQDPVCRVPERYVRREGARVEAHRVLHDVFVPLGMRRFQKSPYYVLSEWLGEADLRERRVSRGYKREFVAKLLERGDGTSNGGLLEGQGLLRPRRLGDDGNYDPLSEESLRGLYQVLTIVYRDVDDDGLCGVFELAFHPGVEIAAHAPRVVETPHGGYPGVWVQREVQTDLALDSRGWPELLGAQQSQVKVLADSVSNHAQLVTVPPLVTKGRRTTAKLVLGPLAEVPLQANGELKPLLLGEYPRAAADQQAVLERQAAEYAGRRAAGVDPVLSQLHEEYDLVVWTGQLREILMQVVGLYQANAGAETLARITGQGGEALAMEPDDIRGQYDMDVVFDARNMDLEYLREKARVYNEILKPLDMRGMVKWDVVVASMFSAFDPNLAERALDTQKGASRREMLEEETNWVKIAAGIEPEMAEGGQDYRLRLQVLQGIAEKNPETLEQLSETSRKILAARVQHLQHQMQQQSNAQTGRTGARPALEQAG